MDVTVTVKWNVVQRYSGWRCLHEAEGGYDSDDRGMPEIRPGINAPSVPFDKDLQLLSWNMNTYNPLFTKSNWRKTYGNWTAFTNGQGFGNSEDPRADFVNMLDTESELPKLMKGIICGGMYGEWKEDGNVLWAIPGIHAIDVNRPIPSMAEVFKNHWYFVATTQYYGKISNFPQGHGSPVYIPYALKEPVAYPKQWFVKWEAEFLPDPLKIYLTP